MKFLLQRFLLILFGIIIAVFSLRVINSISKKHENCQFAQRVGKAQIDECKIFKTDSLLGWKCNPGDSEVTTSPKTTININSQGFRTKEYSLVKGEYKRILLIGDSFTFGWKVSTEKRFSDILQRLVDSSGSAVEIINIGIPGYSLDQECLSLFTQGIKYTPDVVIFALNVNDIQPTNEDISHSLGDNHPMKKPKFVIKGKNLLIKTPTDKEFIFDTLIYAQTYPELHKTYVQENLLFKTLYFLKQFFRQHSQLYFFLVNQIKKSTWMCKFFVEKRLIRSEPETNTYVAENLLLYTKNFLSTRNIEFVVFMFPYETPLQNRWRGNLYEYLLHFFDINKIKVIDSFEPFSIAIESGKKPFLEKDPHWSEEGHKIAAQEIYNFLLKDKKIQISGELTRFQ